MLTLALGIGANTALFSLVHKVLLTPLPFREPERLVMIWSTDFENKINQSSSSRPDFIDWRKQSRSFEGLAAAGFGRVFNLSGDGEPIALKGAQSAHRRPHGPGGRVRDILQMVMRHGLRLAGLGLAAGLAGALAFQRVLGRLLSEMTATDPLTFVTVIGVLAVVALVACFFPARRASKVDPMVALRYE